MLGAVLLDCVPESARLHYTRAISIGETGSLAR